MPTVWEEPSRCRVGISPRPGHGLASGSRLEGRTQLVRIRDDSPKRPAPTFYPACTNRERDPSAPSRMRGRRSGRLDGCERSRIGDAFRPLSPAPFVVVTEAADGLKRERVLVRQKHRENVGVGPVESSFAPYTSHDFAFTLLGRGSREQKRRVLTLAHPAHPIGG